MENEVWIHATENIIKKLTDILNRIWNGEGVPKRWRRGVTGPIHKKGNTENVTNYRGITIMDTAYKLYAAILNSRLRLQIKEKNLLPDTHAGLRAVRWTIYTYLNML